MTLDKIVKRISNYRKNYSRLFVPTSEEYFEKSLKQSYLNISFEKEDIIIDPEFNLKLNSLIDRFPFIEDFLIIRPQIKSYSEFISLAYLIFKDYLERLKEVNTIYIIDSTNQTNTSFAQNVANNVIERFYLNITDIFFCIEKKYSIELQKLKEDENLSSSRKDTNKYHFKPGPNENGLKKICLKYYLIQQFYPEERLYTKKYENQKDFLEKIGSQENANPGSLKTHYSKMKNESLNLIFKENKILFEELLINKKISKYPLCLDFLKKELKN